MGIYDRDYYRDPGGSSGFGGARMWSITAWLIIINIAVFLLDGMFKQTIVQQDDFGFQRVQQIYPIDQWCAFSVYTALYHLQLWRLFTFQFLHAGWTHLASNMISLFFFGQLVESYLGRWRYLAFYLLCGLAGPVMYVLLWMAGRLIYSPYVPLVGASAGIFGVLVAASQIAPRATVLVYGIIPVQLRTLAWIFLAIAFYTVFTGGENAGGQAAHLGGAGMGYLLLRNPQLLKWVDYFSRPRMRYRG